MPRPIPDGYHAVTPYLICRGAQQAIEFYTRAFQAKELYRMPGPDGKIMHAEIQVGDSRVMLADETPDFRSPQTVGGTSVSIMLYVNDVDATFRRAIDSGATVLRDVKNQFYGDRTGTLADPFGHVWTIGTHVEDVSPAEMKRRMAEQGHPA
ncbi:MAG TPA: VOC family protein [Anaeromyxobacter sp.]|nr:VOC family protein [Anaeromyxobacter sp.]